ncbi:MAG: M20/M25/M40 family metallo-hydrolase [Acidobacteria bacterium]|nr:M20/M25/M40 family metallo-hydrolase [Acidobacteriota bacterium]
MQYQRRLRLLLALLLLLLSSNAFAQSAAKPAAAPDAGRLRAHVTYLASDKLEGRRTGTAGAREAARYVARELARVGVQPGFRVNCDDSNDSCYMQEFPYVASVELGRGNALTATRRVGDSTQGAPMAIDFKVGEDWMPVGFGSSGRVEAPLAFVGYGITAAEQNYDDYKGAVAAGKVALAFAGTPDGDSPHARFARAGELRFKAAAARAAGAKALVVIAGEEEFKKDKLATLRYDNAGGDAGLPVAVISRQAAAEVLGLSNAALLAEFEKSLRGGVPVVGVQGAEPGGGVVLSLSTDVVRKEAPAANVVGVLEGSDARLKSEFIVVGAHYDHLGRGGEGSLAAREGEVHHGADDNASGTAGLLELARLFAADRKPLRRTVVFVAFGGEEEGLIGSSYYVQHPAFPLAQTVAMLNMDMIGRLRGGALNVGGVGTAAELRALVEGLNKGDTAAPSPAAERFALRLSEDGFGPSDHSSFYARRVPVLFFFTGTHEDYHKPSDTADRINYEGEAQVLQLVRDIVYRLQQTDARPTYAVAKSEANARTTFRVSLGTVPSYGESTDGLKLDAVREGSPAAAAGMKAGDKVVKLAGRDIRNVYDYTQALSEMKAGQEYEVELLRDGQRLTLKVTPAERKQ